MTIEIEYRKRWKRSFVAVMMLLLLSPIQYMLLENMPDTVFELSILLTALLFYAVFIKMTTRFFSGTANITIDEEKMAIRYNNKTYVIFLSNCKSALLSEMSFLGERYYLLYIKQFNGKYVKLTTMPSTAMISQHPLSRILIYFAEQRTTIKLEKYDKYWEATQTS